MTKVFFDTEFTGLHQATTLMSIGVVTDRGDSFYAELVDYDQSQVNDWIINNVVARFTLSDQQQGNYFTVKDLWGNKHTTIRGTSEEVAHVLTQWLKESGPVQMWSDCLAYDWVLFNTLLADFTNGYPQLPRNIHYIPMDICTLFHLKGVDPDISREKYGYGEVYQEQMAQKHNALFDAMTIKACYEKLVA